MQSIDRIMKIVNVFVFSDPNRYLSITELSKECDLPISSMHRILKAMEKHRMIKQDKKRKLYTLGTMWFEYGLRVYDTDDYVSLFRPELENVMKSVDASVYLFKPVDQESMIVERIDCITQTIRAYDKLGLRTSIYSGVANLSMLAFMSQNQKDDNDIVIDQKVSALQNELENIKEKGYAIGEDEWSKGITTVAVPIVSNNDVVAGAISIKLEGTNLPENQLKDLAKELIDTSNRISWRLIRNH